MKTLLRKIYHKIRNVPVIGHAAQRLLAILRNKHYGPAHAVSWEQARQLGSLTERVEVLELLSRTQAHAMTGMAMALTTLKREAAEQAGQMSKRFEDQHELIEREHARGRQYDHQFEHQAKRTEFVRDEVLFELRKALKIKPAPAPGEASENVAIEPRILPHVKLEDGEPIRLNVGCGHIPHADKLNVDVRELPGVDIIAGAENLPFDPGSVDLIYAAHLLEHFPRRYLLDVLLPHWKSLLKADGVLQLVVPDSEAMLASHGRGEIDFATLTEVTFGKQDYDGDFHYAMYSPTTIADLLREAGFKHIEMLANDRINGDCREMEVQAGKS